MSTLTGTQVMLLVASETGHVYTFATRKLQPMITSNSGKALIQTCLNSPDPPPGSSAHTTQEQRMNPSGFEETELTYSVGEDDSKVCHMFLTKISTFAFFGAFNFFIKSKLLWTLLVQALTFDYDTQVCTNLKY